MNFTNKINYLFDHIGYEKLFLSVFPMLVAYSCACEMFKTDYLSGIHIILSFIFLNLSINIFDDFMDWTMGLTNKRHELEQLGIRGNYQKCSHFYYDKKSPRKYLLTCLLFFILFLFLFLKTIITTHKYLLLLILPLLFIVGFIIYSNSGKKITKYFGYEFFTTILISPIAMLFVFYTMTNHVTLKFVLVCVIFFFLILNILYTSSLLSYKQDKMTRKQTLPTICDTSNFKIYSSLFLTIIPYVLIFFGIFFNIFSNIYYLLFIGLPFSIWHFSLMYMHEKAPQKIINWHVLMGIDNKKIEDEQNNLSWYYVRYNFIRNIFIFLSMLFMFCSIDFQTILAF